MTKTLKVFCASEQKETDHDLAIANNGEVVLTCTSDLRTEEELKDTESAVKSCGRFLKFARGTSSKEIKEYLTKHKAQHEGQVTVAAQEAEGAKFLEELLKE